MIKIAVYGKGGIGKSTTVSCLSAVLAAKGLTVMQIGCDPKADSTLLLHQNENKRTVLSLFKEKGNTVTLDEMVTRGYNGVLCVEAGGPVPGLGCAGRGIMKALEMLDDRHYEKVYQPDIVFYDVLGDVVCGGFTMPIRKGYADKVCIVTSGEKMSLFAARNISKAIHNFKNRGYAKLGGIILNKRNVLQESEKIEALSKELKCPLIGALDFCSDVQIAAEKNKTVIEVFPNSSASLMYQKLANQIENYQEVFYD